MKTSLFTASVSSEYKRLEGISRPSSAQILLENLWRSLLHNLTRGSEIQIWKVKTRDGFVWRVYDPHTNSVMGFSTELEVRSWIESRYSR